jgi:hypothetical protein
MELASADEITSAWEPESMRATALIPLKMASQVSGIGAMVGSGGGDSAGFAKDEAALAEALRAIRSRVLSLFASFQAILTGAMIVVGTGSFSSGGSGATWDTKGEETISEGSEMISARLAAYDQTSETEIAFPSVFAARNSSPHGQRVTPGASSSGSEAREEVGTDDEQGTSVLTRRCLFPAHYLPMRGWREQKEGLESRVPT